MPFKFNGESLFSSIFWEYVQSLQCGMHVRNAARWVALVSQYFLNRFA